MRGQYWFLLCIAVVVAIVWLISVGSRRNQYSIFASPGTPAIFQGTNASYPITYPGPAGPFSNAGMGSARNTPIRNPIGIGYNP